MAWPALTVLQGCNLYSHRYAHNGSYSTGCSSVVEYLAKTREAPDWIPNIAKEKKPQKLLKDGVPH